MIECSLDSHYIHLTWIINSQNKDSNNDNFTSFRFDIWYLKGLWAYLQNSGHTLRGLFILIVMEP